jgi:DNA-binding SARP family transcriptional activator/tetratricopeptide (TPR) repeat protein
VAATRFAILGPVEVYAGGRTLHGLAPRHRAVLAYLLVHARTALSADRLVDAIWGMDPPGTARSQIHATITAIRRTLREAGSEHVLQTRTGGYVITPEPGQLDLDEFTELVSTPTDDRQDSVDRIRAALRLWRGQPLADVNAEYAPATRARLEDRRLAAVERLAELELSLGRHHGLVEELIEHVEANPLREGLVTALMRALYRAGRQVDALSAARAFRTTLADELGLDPTAAFTDLESAILRSDPSLDMSPGAGTPDPQPRHTNVLPYDIPDFTGRTTELDRLVDATPDDRLTVLSIDGMAGVGKTTLAVHVAHRLAPRYPDGQLFLDLQAHTAGHRPLELGAALDDLLRQLGVPAGRVPAEPIARAALWRAELSGRRVVVVLDNVADADHVRHLLPGASPSTFLITSRVRLTDLDGATTLSVDVMPATDAAELFARVVGTRAESEPDAVRDVLQMCGFLPLAVRIAAARLRHRPQWTVQYLADRLRNHRRRLSELSTSDRGVDAAFALSYEHLATSRRRMFRLLALHPGQDVEPDAAAALADVTAAEAESALEDLLDAHVLLQHTPGRYTFHDLLREHAYAAATAEETDVARRDALVRLIVHYLTAADAALRDPASADDAARWLDVERANLIAIALHTADPALPGGTGRLAATLHRHLYDRAQQADAVSRYTEVLDASRRRGDRAGEARVLIDLGWVHWLRGDYQSSADRFHQALALSRRIGDTFGQARALQGLGNVSLRRDDVDRAGAEFLEALDLFRSLGDRYGEAGVLTGLGSVSSRRGEHDDAVHRHEQAIEICREIDDLGGLGDALNDLGATHRRAGRYEQAAALHHQARATFRSIGYRRGEAITSNDLGETARHAGDIAGSVVHHTAALTLADEIGSPTEKARAHDGLARAEAALGHDDVARDHGRAAETLHTEFGASAGIAEAVDRHLT